MRNIFKRQNDNNKADAQVFENWDEVEMEALKAEIKNKKTEELKEWLEAIKSGILIGIGAAVLGLIIGELMDRK